jgi:glycosyltransferase involved in cell wall biosynthesis
VRPDAGAPTRRPLVVHVATGGDAIGGAEQHVICLAPHLARRGFEVALAFLGDGAAPELARSRGLWVEVVRKRGRGDLTTIWRLARLLRRLRPQMLHTHTLTGNFYGRFASLLAGVPHRVTTVHGFMGELLRHDPRGRFGNRLLFWQNQYMNRCSERLIAISQGVRDWLRAAGVAERKLRLIRCGIDLSETVADRDEVRAGWGVKEGEWVIGNVARAHPVKDQMTLLEAVLPLLERDPRARLVVVGDGPEVPRLRARANASPAAAQVLLPGHLPGANRLMAGLDVFALSSRMEGISLALLEAMAARRPVVATDVGGTREVVTEGVSGLLVPPESPDRLRAALQKLRGDGGLAARLGEAARRAVEDSYDARKTGEQVADLYREVIAPEGARCGVTGDDPI